MREEPGSSVAAGLDSEEGVGAQTMLIPIRLISIGEAWVDPGDVVGVDAAFTENDPSWPNVRVALRSGLLLYGTRDPRYVAAAVRDPSADRYDELRGCEADGSEPETPADRARRRQRARPTHCTSLRPVDGAES